MAALIPSGNVPLQSVQALEKHPMVASVIPISLGDNFRSYCIVGTTHAYLDLYQASLAYGRLWAPPMEVVLGSTTAARLGAGLILTDFTVLWSPVRERRGDLALLRMLELLQSR